MRKIFLYFAYGAIVSYILIAGDRARAGGWHAPRRAAPGGGAGVGRGALRCVACPVSVRTPVTGMTLSPHVASGSSPS